MTEDEAIGFVDGLEEIKKKCRHLILLSEVYRVGFYQGQCGKPFNPVEEEEVLDSPYLHRAVFDGNLEHTKMLVKAGEDPNQKLSGGPKIFTCVQDGWKTMYGYFEGTTPLMIASQRGHLKIVKFLRNQGAIIGKTDCLGFNAFLLACGSNRLDVCRYLLGHRSPLEFRDELNGMTPLLIACRAGNEVVARWLIEEGANVHVCDFTGKGALHFAAWNYNVPLMQLLVSKFVKINSKDRDGNTPLHLMLSDSPMEPPATEEFLEQTKEVDTIQGVLKTMAKLRDANIIVDLGLTIRRGTDDLLGKSYEKWKSLSAFLKLGADPNVRNREGKTPLQVLLEGLPEAYISKGRVVGFQPNRNQELLVLLLILLKLGEDPEMKLAGGITSNDLSQVQKNALAQRILNRYRNNVNDVIENDDVVQKTIAKYGSKYLLTLKQVENEIETLSNMIIEPVRQRSLFEFLYDGITEFYQYVDSVVSG